MKRFSLLSMVGLVSVSAACAAGNGGNAGGAGGTGGSGGAKTATTTSTGATATATTGTAFMTSSTSTGMEGPAEVFGHSKDTLYKLDPVSKAVTKIALMTGCPDVLDIALDKDSHIFATTHMGLFDVNKTTAACTLIANGDYPNSLSFVPAGTLDPNVEALVGYIITPSPGNKNQYIRIDTTSGTITNIGQPWSEAFVTSGDIVSVKNGPTYLTVKGGTCTKYDCLVEVNPQSGTLVKNYGELTSASGGYQKVFGLAFWAGSVYGFDNTGHLFEVKVQGNTTLTTLINAPGGPSLWWGAGSTTSAPPVPN